MVHYKLYSFPFRGYIEPARILFALSETPYDDVRIPRDEYPKHKPEMPFGQVPVLEIDGKKYGQSGAIIRYLANTFGYAGKTPAEKLAVDALYEQYRDYQNELRPFFTVLAGFQEGDKDKLYKEVALPARDKFFAFAKNWLKEAKSGFLVGKELTFVDLALAEHAATLSEYYPDFLVGNKEIEEHMKKIRAIPKIAKWIEKRPKSTF